jgi:dihydroxyacetone kinase-like protein
VKKFINAPKDIVDEMLKGILAAHPKELTCAAGNLRCIIRTGIPDKVTMMSGGGSGHFPLFMGYVGQGLLDGCAVGDVFRSPSFAYMPEVMRAINKGNSVLCIYGNYARDKMNFEKAAGLAEREKIRTFHVVVADDVASAPLSEKHKRRGVAGLFFVFKTAGAAAEEGHEIEDVIRIAEKASANVRSMGVALSPCVIPEVGKALFTLGENEMELGIGIHGEPGIERTRLEPVDAVVTKIMDRILDDMPLKRGDVVSVLMNGLGATQKEELYVAYRQVDNILKSLGVRVFHVYVGELTTSMEMAGFSISIFKLDDELRRLLATPARTPFFEQVQL